jgi:hypothetical protein
MFDIVLDKQADASFNIQINKNVTINCVVRDDTPLIDSRLGRQHRSSKTLEMVKFEKDLPAIACEIKNFKQFVEFFNNIDKPELIKSLSETLKEHDENTKGVEIVG